MSAKPETHGERAEAVAAWFDSTGRYYLANGHLESALKAAFVDGLAADATAGGEAVYFTNAQGYGVPMKGMPTLEPGTKLYTRPQQAAQVAQPLTEEERREAFNDWYANQSMPQLLARIDPQQAAHNAMEFGFSLAIGIGKDQAP